MAQHGPTALPQGANDGGDGSTMEKATWVVGSDKNARSFVLKQGPTFMRCNLTNALDFNDAGYQVFDPSTGRQVKFMWKGTGHPQFQAFAHQYWEVQQEEGASLSRRNRLHGEDLGEDGEEDFQIVGDSVFDPVEQAPSTPSSGTRGNLATSPSDSHGRGSPSTPRGRDSGTPRGCGSGGSGRGRGSLRSPTLPSRNMGKGPAGGSPSAGAT